MLELNQTAFVILGSSGKVASTIADQFSKFKIPFFSIPWSSKPSLPSQIPSVTDGGVASAELRECLKDFKSVIFIDCL